MANTIDDHYVEYLNEIGIPDDDLKSSGGRIPDGEDYGEWMRDNDPVAFDVGRNEWVRGRNQ